MNKYACTVGSSSKSPEEIIDLAIRFGKMMVDLGIGVSSGDAVRMDRAFYAGARQSRRFYEVPSRIYLAWNGVGLFDKSYHDPSKYMYDAQRSPNWDIAQSHAKEARGSFDKLGKGGIALHTRNTFQVLGESLVEPAILTMLYAVPTKWGVAGGTNTAFKISLKAKIPTFNLFYDDVKEAVIRLLEEHEVTHGKPDLRIDKSWIDPRQWGDVSQEKRIVDPVHSGTPQTQRSGDVDVYQTLKGLIY